MENDNLVKIFVVAIKYYFCSIVQNSQLVWPLFYMQQWNLVLQDLEYVKNFAQKLLKMCSFYTCF